MGTHFQGTAAEQQALNTFIKLMRASDAVNNQINYHLSDYNLTVSQFGVLEAIYHLGPLTQTQLGEKILKSSGNITYVVDNLEAQDLVERVRDSEDRRRYFIHMTPEGRQLISQIFPRHVARIVEVMQTLSLEEQTTLDRLCRKLGLGAENGS
jgi:MarR family 2-MHQ and catechol resistance regulon transcriptional repressor